MLEFAKEHTETKYLIWVLVPIDKKGQCNKSDAIKVAQFTKIVQPKVLYVERPTNIADSLRYYTCITNMVFVTNKIDLNNLPEDMQQYMSTLIIHRAFASAGKAYAKIDDDDFLNWLEFFLEFYK